MSNNITIKITRLQNQVCRSALQYFRSQADKNRKRAKSTAGKDRWWNFIEMSQKLSHRLRYEMSVRSPTLSGWESTVLSEREAEILDHVLGFYVKYAQRNIKRCARGHVRRIWETERKAALDVREMLAKEEAVAQDAA